MPDDWKTTKAQISRFLFTNPGKHLNQKSATGAVVFNPSDYCPYSEDCLSFRSHARGENGSKGVQSHLRKLHADIAYYLVPCTLGEFVKYDKEHPGAVTNIMDGMRLGRLKFAPVVSSPEEASSMEKRLRLLFAEKRHKGNCKIFLSPDISSKSRHINPDDIQPVLEALTETWVRSSLPDRSLSAKADATRARMHAIAILANACEEEESFETIASKVPALLNL